MELLQGMRNRTELMALQKSLALRKAERLPLTPAITERAIVVNGTVRAVSWLTIG